MVVPIFVEKKGNESLEEAFLNTNFETVGSVIIAMMENDEMLEEEVKSIRRNKGITGNYNTNPIEKYVEVIGSNINLNVLEEVIKTRIIESATNIFDENWGKGIHYLKKYIKEHNNSWVPRKMKIGNFNFGSWVFLRRGAYKNKDSVNIKNKFVLISQKQIDELEKIDGWAWDVDEEKLEIVLEFLMGYYIQFGDYRITSMKRLGIKLKRGEKGKIYHRDFEIISYVMRMKRNYSALEKVNFDHSKMPRGYKIDQFIIDGFKILPEWSWEDAYDEIWMEHFSVFKKFKAEKGHVLVKEKHDPKLFRWVSMQRTKAKKVVYQPNILIF